MVRTPIVHQNPLTNLRTVIGQHGSVATKTQSSQVHTIHTLRGTGMFPSSSTNHLEEEKSGYVLTNTCPFTKGNEDATSSRYASMNRIPYVVSVVFMEMGFQWIRHSPWICGGERERLEDR